MKPQTVSISSAAAAPTNTLAIWSPRPAPLGESKAPEWLADQIVVYHLPVLAIVSQPVSAAALEALDALIFTSYYAVREALAQLPRQRLASLQRIAIGKRTESALRDAQLAPIMTAPPPHNSEALLASPAWQTLSCQRLGIVCGVGGRRLLQDELAKTRQHVRRIACYRRDKIHLLPEFMVKFVDDYSIGGIILSSNDVVDAVASQLNRANLRQCFRLPAFALSARIAAHAETLGFEHLVIAERANQHFLYQRIINWWEVAL
ncbi:MAG: hypothetical protein CR974_04310 [Gammaproteobacteria bacterium]|nr:MAG: hypothetical protein CR974_04310 [Gammaproteobacteria bacterium]